jgi:uncharacterized protein YabN with tetrapyrrole methylase and pyrophosphatase domain
MHFEDIWNHAEDVGQQLHKDEEVSDAVKRIEQSVAELKTDGYTNKAQVVGDILFDLCVITERLNINSAAALRHAIENRKAEILDPDD